MKREMGYGARQKESEASDQGKMIKLFADRERYLEDRMKELQVRLHGRVSGCAPDRSP